MSVSIATMRALGKQIKALDKAIEQQFEIIPNTLTSIPGIGKVYSSGIIAEIGDINRFQSQSAVAKYAGLVWTQPNPATSRHSIPGSSSPATVTSVTISWKPPTL